MYSDLLTHSVALCLTGVILDKLTGTYECIDWLITSVVAVCLTDVILAKLTVTYECIDWLITSVVANQVMQIKQEQ